MATIADNIAVIRERIAAAAARAGRDPVGIDIVAVSKGVEPERITRAVKDGINILGENRVQEASSKVESVVGDVNWHMVGHLQRNKVKEAIRIFKLIHSLDSIRLAEEIDMKAREAGLVMDALVQVNTSGEESKFGLEPGETVDFIKQVARLDGLVIKGLMTIGAFLPEPEAVRPCFRRLRELRDEVNGQSISNVEMQYLSMGMSNDFEVAIEEGANLIRVGTAIFGDRVY